MDVEQADSSHEKWADTAELVAENPAAATAKSLRLALAYLSYRRAALILNARRKKREPSEKKLAAIDARLQHYAELLQK